MVLYKCTCQCIAPTVGDRWGFEHRKVLVPTTWGHFLFQIPTYPPLPSVKYHEIVEYWKTKQDTRYLPLSNTLLPGRRLAVNSPVNSRLSSTAALFIVVGHNLDRCINVPAMFNYFFVGWVRTLLFQVATLS